MIKVKLGKSIKYQHKPLKSAKFSGTMKESKPWREDERMFSLKKKENFHTSVLVYST